jgi:hypothetical protein
VQYVTPTPTVVDSIIYISAAPLLLLPLLMLLQLFCCFYEN